VAVSFISGGNWSTRRKPPTCRKSLKHLSHNVVSSTHKHNPYESAVKSKINRIEIRRGNNQEWTMQRQRLGTRHTTKTNKAKNTTHKTWKINNTDLTKNWGWRKMIEKG